MAASNTVKLVVDTDVGSDDAIALIICAAAEQKRDAEILGITCVHGNTSLDNVCANTLKTLHTVGRLNIPVYRGASESLVETAGRAEDIHGSDGFGDFHYHNPPETSQYIQTEHAVSYLVRIVKENPGQVTLLTLGPLTNIALALRIDPEFGTNVKEILIMGGNNQGIGNLTAAAEFNFGCDPHAAFVVIHNMKCPIIIFPWETAYKHCGLPYDCRINCLGTITTSQAELLNKVEAPTLASKMLDIWAWCDPVAAAIAIYPQIVTAKKRLYVSVEIHGEDTKGAMIVDHLNKLKKEPNATVVERVDVEMYKKILFDTFSIKFTKGDKFEPFNCQHI